MDLSPIPTGKALSQLEFSFSANRVPGKAADDVGLGFDDLTAKPG